MNYIPIQSQIECPQKNEVVLQNHVTYFKYSRKNDDYNRLNKRIKHKNKNHGLMNLDLSDVDEVNLNQIQYLSIFDNRNI